MIIERHSWDIMVHKLVGYVYVYIFLYLFKAPLLVSFQNMVYFENVTHRQDILYRMSTVLIILLIILRVSLCDQFCLEFGISWSRCLLRHYCCGKLRYFCQIISCLMLC